MKCEIGPDVLTSKGDEAKAEPAEHGASVKGGKEVMTRKLIKAKEDNSVSLVQIS